MWRPAPLRPYIWSIRSSTTVPAIRPTGWRKVVSGGLVWAVIGVPSKPTTETSTGTSLPHALTPAIAPSAIMSPPVTTAVAPASSSLATPARPPSIVNRVSDISYSPAGSIVRAIPPANR